MAGCSRPRPQGTPVFTLTRPTAETYLAALKRRRREPSSVLVHAYALLPSMRCSCWQRPAEAGSAEPPGAGARPAGTWAPTTAATAHRGSAVGRPLPQRAIVEPGAHAPGRHCCLVDGPPGQPGDAGCHQCRPRAPAVRTTPLAGGSAPEMVEPWATRRSSARSSVPPACWQLGLSTTLAEADALRRAALGGWVAGSTGFCRRGDCGQRTAPAHPRARGRPWQGRGRRRPEHRGGTPALHRQHAMASRICSPD